ncbi:hypothetical protein [Sandaracinus amylolyticus]|uniref:Lipoprotein n=1 Tax=Sandaracinus amylolyticus TaxID=927083 RepID=A0A0F6W6M7_9BACT|nr:hypothetical protein [Sandaracinus amylolyticus]AKF08608.1 hypothetical protein DB32_005757 [Sandaracinus amylolyticus]
MTHARITTLALSIALSMLVGCGGGGARAALQVQQYPGDYNASPRRLESLAREYENTFGCTEADSISIVGMGPGVYAVSGCNAMRDYMLGCRPGGYGQICDWTAMPDLAQQAAVDLNCGPQYIDVQLGVQGQRVAEGCGYRAVYMMRCGGTCSWVLSAPVMQATPTEQGGGGSYTY